MKTAIVVSLIASAAAFAPVQDSVRSTSLQASFENEIGAQPPLGFWDPLGLTLDSDQKRFDRLRYVEAKHGRIAMLAIVGHMVTTAGNRLPGMEDVPAGLAAFSKLSLTDLAPTLCFIGFLELFVMKDVTGNGIAPSDFMNGMFKWDVSDEEKREKLSIELNNGRAAQMGILGLMMHEQMTGEPYILNEFLGYPTHFNEAASAVSAVVEAVPEV